VAGIGVNKDFEGVIAPLEQNGQTGDRIGIKGGVAVPQLTEKRDPRIPEMNEVREQVAVRVREETARARLEGIARDLAANARRPQTCAHAPPHSDSKRKPQTITNPARRSARQAQALRRTQRFTL
jgi:hypothetical protein